MDPASMGEAAAGPGADRGCDKTPYPFNFSKLKEGCFDPCLGKQVEWLIASDDGYIVYLDENQFVEWTMNDNSLLDGQGGLLTRVGLLEAAQTRHLTRAQLETYKRLIGEAVGRMFEKDAAAAESALQTAEVWIRARGEEAARVAALKGATCALVAFGVPLLIGAAVLSDEAWSTRLLVTCGTLLGVVGAWLSVLQRTGSANLDIGAGTTLHFVEGLVRIAIGGVAGFFVSLLLIAKWILPAARDNAALFGAVCLVAGLSERLMNSLATGLEAKVAMREELQSATGPGAGGVDRGPNAGDVRRQVDTRV